MKGIIYGTIFSFILWCLIGTGIALAAPRLPGIPLTIVNIQGGVSDRDAIKIFEYVERRGMDAGVDFRLNRFVSAAWPLAWALNLDNGSMLLVGLREAYRALVVRDRLVHVIAPAPFVNGAKWILGYAFSGCVYDKGGTLSFSTATTHSVKGEPRLDMSAIAALHEILHSLGASHSEGVMHEAAASRWPSSDYVADVTRRQVARCVARRGR